MGIDTSRLFLALYFYSRPLSYAGGILKLESFATVLHNFLIHHRDKNSLLVWLFTAIDFFYTSLKLTSRGITMSLPCGYCENHNQSTSTKKDHAASKYIPLFAISAVRSYFFFILLYLHKRKSIVIVQIKRKFRFICIDFCCQVIPL